MGKIYTLPRDIFTGYDTLLFFDTETSGLNAVPTSVNGVFTPEKNIVEIGAVQFTRDDISGYWERSGEVSDLLKLPEGRKMPSEVSDINHITDELLECEGIDAKIAFDHLASMILGKTLAIAYNAHFDMNFLVHESENRSPDNLPAFKSVDVYDAMLTARCRLKGNNGIKASHKLCDVLLYYNIEGVENSHRALDDVEALIAVTEAFHKEREQFGSIDEQINVFPYYEKYGIPGDHLTDEKFTFMNQFELSQQWPRHKIVMNTEELKDFRAGMMGIGR